MNLTTLTDNKKETSLFSAHLMYVATIYTGETIEAIPLMSDIVAVDWQSRLFYFLAEKKFSLSFKPHPESYTMPPNFFKEKYGVQILSGYFSDVWSDADIFLFDYPQTSAFREALYTDRPIIVFDFPRLKISSVARPLLEKRCGLVKAWFDAEGRAQVQWNKLEQAIVDAQFLRDTSFVDSFFPE